MEQQPVDTGAPLAAPGRRASVAGYWIAGAIALIGVVAAAVWAITGTVGVIGEVNAFPRIDVPGSDTVNIDETGGRVVFYEGTGKPHWELLSLEIAGPDGSPVPIATYVTDLTYSFGGRTATAIATFEATEEGTYSVSTSNAPEPGARIAIGNSFAKEAVGRIFGAFAIGGLSVIVAIILFIVTLLRRRKNAPT